MRNLKKDEIEMKARREAMLREGFRLFAEKGIEPVAMQHVADASGVGIATLYRYYNTKLALVLDIGAKKWEEFGTHVLRLREERDIMSKTAAEEFALYLDCYIELYRNHKELLRFNQNFNNYVQHEGATKEQLAPYLAAIGTFVRMFHALYEKAKLDGTLRTDLPEDKMVAATSHIRPAVPARDAQALIYDAESESDRTEEFEMLKRALLREFAV
jgi:AcrR family transcriptional regulator